MIAESGKKLLDTLFNDGEEICCSHDEFGYASVPIDSLSYEVVELLSPNPSKGALVITTRDIKLVALNPIKGWRRDEFVTAHRNFLVELDDGPLADQFDYVKKMKLPYSACVFSGGKSLHFAVCLQDALPSYELYYYYANWILNVMSKADPMTKNPSRSIRMPGAIRDGREQKLVDLRARITLDDLNAWLSAYKGFRPEGFGVEPKRRQQISDDTNKAELLPRWVGYKLKEGIDRSRGRNVEWFKIASEFGKAGYSLEEAVEIMETSFVSEYDFKRPEWMSTVRSGLKNGKRKAGFE
jgi:hypothetical protein